jgi:hypothetical protein
MKSVPLLTLISLTVAANLYAADPQVLLSEGQQAMLRGDTATAKSKFTEVNRMDPKNPTAIGFLKQIAVQEAKTPLSPQTEKDLAALIVPQVQFREATLGSALDFLKKKVTELSSGKKSVNFVLSPGVDQDTKVTINLSNIPVTEVLRYVAELSSARVEYQKFAVMIKPVGGAASATPAAPAEKPLGQ